MKRQLLLVSCFVSIPFISFSQINLSWTEKSNANLPEEVHLYETTSTVNGRAFKAWYAIADMSTGNIELRTELTDAKAPSEHVTGFSEDVYICTNGGYFGGNSSYSMVYDHGSAKANNIASLGRTGGTYYVTRGAVGVDQAQNPSCGWTYNVNGQNYLYPTPSLNVEGDTPMEMPSATYPANGVKWNPYTAIGGAPVLVKNGEVMVDYTQTTGGFYAKNYELLQTDIFATGVRGPRTAIGVTSDHKMILFVCDGRQDSWSLGVDLIELAEIMKGLGCVDALNLDGGGSSAMIAGGTLLNKPSDGAERAVPSVVMFAKKAATVDKSKNTFTKVWTRSVADENLPSWFGANTERGIAYANGHIYVASRAGGTFVKVLDALTGSDVADLKIGEGIIAGGTFAVNDVETTSDNQILVCNMTTNASTTPFKIYRWKDESSEPEVYLSFTAGSAYRIGDNFTVKGDLSKDAVIYAAVSSKNLVYRWMVKDGVLNTTPVEIVIAGLPSNNMGASGSVAPYGITENDHFILNANSLTPLECTPAGEKLGKIDPNLVATLSNGMDLFYFNSGRYLVSSQLHTTYGAENSQSSVLIDLTGITPDKVTDAQVYGFTPILGSATNGNATGDACARVTANDVIIYTLATNNGISAYRPDGLLLDTALKNAATATSARMYPNPATEYLQVQLKDGNTSGVIRIYDLQGHLLMQQNLKGYDKVQVSALHKALYLVEVITGNESSTQKMTLGK